MFLYFIYAFYTRLYIMKRFKIVYFFLFTFSAIAQNPQVAIVFRFADVPDSGLSIRHSDYYPTSYCPMQNKKEYIYKYSGILGHQKADTLDFIDKNNRAMRIIYKNDVKIAHHYSKLYFDFPKFSEGKTVVTLKELFLDDHCHHYTSPNKFAWQTSISQYFYQKETEHNHSFVQLQNAHPLLAPSDTLTFKMNGNLMDDGSCNGKLFFEIFKIAKDSLQPVLVFPGFTPSLCGMGFHSFNNTSFKLLSLYAKNHYYGITPVNMETGEYLFRFYDMGAKRGYIFSDTIGFNTILKTNKSIYNKVDSIHISFKTTEGFGFQVTRCGPSTTYQINLEQYDENKQKWETVGYALPPPRCLAIYESTSQQQQQLELTIPVPTLYYNLKYPATFRLSTVVYENQYKTQRLNCTSKTVYSDEFRIE